MSIADDGVIFNSDDKGKRLIIFLGYCVENYLTFGIKIKSGAFEGESSFCISKETLAPIIDRLLGMHNNLVGVCKIEDYDSDAYINIEMGKFGHLFVSDQIGGSHQGHYMRFKYTADQTVLLNLIKVFKSALFDFEDK